MAYEIFTFSLIVSKIVHYCIYGKRNVPNVLPSAVHILKLQLCKGECYRGPCAKETRKVVKCSMNMCMCEVHQVDCEVYIHIVLVVCVCECVRASIPGTKEDVTWQEV